MGPGDEAIQDTHSTTVDILKLCMCESALCEIIASLSFWDPNLVSELLSDRVAKNLMYIEAVADIDRGHWEVGRERKGELTSLQKKGQKKEVSG